MMFNFKAQFQGENMRDKINSKEIYIGVNYIIFFYYPISR